MTAMSAQRARSLDWPATVRETTIAAVVTAAMAIPMVGLHTVDANAGLVIDPRWGSTAIAVLLVALGRFSLSLVRQGVAVPVLAASLVLTVVSWFVPLPTMFLHVAATGTGVVLALRAAIAIVRHNSPLTPQERELRSDRMGARFQDAARYLGPAAVAIALVLPFLPFTSRYWLDVSILVLTYVMLGWGLNIVVGLAGLLDLGYVAFYAVGAYSYGLLAQYFGLDFWACLPLAGVLASMAGLLLGFPVLRLRGDYFAIVTLGFGEIIRIVITNWSSFTGGPNGVSSIPEPSFFGLATFARHAPKGHMTVYQLLHIPFNPEDKIIFLYYLILALALIVNFFTLRIRRLPLGRAWEALREDDIACTALGIDRTKIKLAAFAIAAMFGGFAGSFFATRQGFISPDSFTFIESALILAIVVLGGMGSQMGVVIATLLVIGMPEVFRDLVQYRMLAFGGGMVLIMIWRPRGLLAHRDPTIYLHTRRSARQRQADAEAEGRA